MRKLSFLLVILLLSATQLLAQRTITGKVTSADDGNGIPGVTVLVKGTSNGVLTDLDGKYSINVLKDATALQFSFVGMTKQEIALTATNVVNVVMQSEAQNIEGVVVTALGITREKKSLGYAVQEIGGDQIKGSRESNFVNAISGKIAGVQIKQSSTMGGSTNVLIRGNKSLTGNNQALFVIDGVPFDNSISNTAYVANGQGGYDYGNTASDINPEDIESMSVLKGAAATVLYGSRAANGVILITTKKGSTNKGVGVTINSGVFSTTADKSTLPKIQKEYGGGYGAYYEDPTGYFWYADLKGTGTPQLIVPTSEDASWGAKFDPNIKVIDWVGLDPLDPVNYLREVPWVAAKHDIRDFFENGVKYTNSVAVDGGNDLGHFRVSYTNNTETGIMPNSKMKKNMLSFNGSYNFTKKFSVESSASYVKDDNIGRYGTGYDPGNPMQSLGQWFQANVDIQDLKKYVINPDGSQRTWNYAYYDDFSPIYHNNIYWTRNVNYETDGRNRLFGYVNAQYKILPSLTLEARGATDYYSEKQEERIAIGSNQTSEYNEFLRNFNETNFDLMLKFNKAFAEKWSTTGVIGANSRRTLSTSIYGSTIGGLQVPDLYILMNSKSPVTTTETNYLSGVNSLYGNISLGYNNLVYFDLSGRAEKSSTLPASTNLYFYPSVSTSFVLSQLPGIKDIKQISFAKLRLNYASVGNSAPVYSTRSYYNKLTNWKSIGVFAMPTILPNDKLKPESTRSIEAGLEASFFEKRLGFDISYYKTNTIDQIMPVNISRASGYNQRYVNSGEVENKGIELALNATPIIVGGFSWDIQVNWFQNKNKVLSLYEGVENILLSSAWDISTNITVGEPFGVLRGTNFVYTNGKRTVDADGNYLYAKDADGNLITDAILGNVQPDWNSGISNTFHYKGISLYALIDISHGGSIYSVDQKYGVATGLFEETAGLNAKGKPKRDPVADGGGIILDGVKEDGTPNDIYIWAGDWGGAWLYDYIPTAAYVYDASYVKLREVSITYALPSQIIKKTPFTKLSVGISGRNLWIIHKNTPYFDPETNMSAGNIQGIADGAYPSTRTYGVNITVGF